MTSQNPPILILLGGFLGAGKTTLILAAARILQARGIRTAAILNDQGDDLVDTHWMRSNGVTAAQVTGGCFCCRFSDLIDAADALRAHAAEVIFAEAVGSCADISATTLQPLKLHYRDRFRLAPYSVLVDAQQARHAANNPQTEIAFLFRNQLDEADLVCFTKSDLYSEFPRIDAPAVRYLSAVSGRGIEAWLDEVLSLSQSSGSKILEIDYEHYARAEASLAWLNASATVAFEDSNALSAPSLLGPFMEHLASAIKAASLQIAHLKISAESNVGTFQAAIVGDGDSPQIQGDLTASPALLHKLLINIRASGDDATLLHIVRTALAELPGSVSIERLNCFRPGRPTPQHRIREVI